MRLKIPTYDEELFSKKFVRTVRRYYRRKLNRYLGPCRQAQLGSYQKLLLHAVQLIVIEDRETRNRPSPILALSKAQYEHVAKHIVNYLLAPRGQRLAHSRHPKSGEIRYMFCGRTPDRLWEKALAVSGIIWLAERVADRLTYVPDTKKIPLPDLRLSLEQEFEMAVEHSSLETQERGYHKIVQFG